MCSRFRFEEWTGLAAGELPARTSRRLNAHLAICASCADEWRSLEQLWAAASDVSRMEAPAAFRERVAASLPPAPVRDRRPPRRVLLGALAAASAALPLAFLLVPARRSLAYADVLHAMQSVQTAEWTETTEMTGPRVRYTGTANVWARVDPPAVFTRSSGVIWSHGRVTRNDYTETLQDYRGMLFHDLRDDRWSAAADWGRADRTAGTRAIVRDDLTGSRDLQEGMNQREPLAARHAGITSMTGEYLRYNGRALYLFRSSESTPFWSREELVWVDPQTRRVVRRELTSRDSRDGQPEMRRDVETGFRYDVALPPGTLDVEPAHVTVPVGDAITWDDQTQGLWSGMPDQQKRHIDGLLAELVTAWGHGDFADFCGLWDFGFETGLPRATTTGQAIITTPAQREREWEQRLAKRRQEPLTATGHVQNVFAMRTLPEANLRLLGMSSLPPKASELLIVPMTAQIPLGHGASTGAQGFVYLRREGDQYRVVRWDFPW